MLKRKLRGSTLVVVLVVMGIAALVLVYILSKIHVQIQQYTLEKTTTQAEQQAKSALDKLTKQFINNPSAFGPTPTEVPLGDSGLQICKPDATKPEERCSASSKVYVRRYKKIIRYSLNNDETIEITMAEAPNSVPASSSTVSIFTDPYENGIGDVLVLMAYRYDGTNGLKVVGECVAKFRNTAENVSCLGDLTVVTGISDTATNVSADAAKTYGAKYFVVRSNSAVSFYRLKALLHAADAEIPVSVAGPISGSNPADLPEGQVQVFTAVVYTEGEDVKQTYTELTRMVWIHPQMPEVFDWVLFNGSNSPIEK